MTPRPRIVGVCSLVLSVVAAVFVVWLSVHDQWKALLWLFVAVGWAVVGGANLRVGRREG